MSGSRVRFLAVSILMLVSPTLLIAQTASGKDPTASKQAGGEQAQLEEYLKQQKRDVAMLESQLAQLQLRVQTAKKSGNAQDAQRAMVELQKVKMLLSQMVGPDQVKTRATQTPQPKRIRQLAAKPAKAETKDQRGRLQSLFEALMKARASGNTARVHELQDEIRTIFDAEQGKAQAQEDSAPDFTPSGTVKKPGLSALWKHLERLERGLFHTSKTAPSPPEVIAAEKELVKLVKAIHEAKAKGDPKLAAKLTQKAKTILDRVLAAKRSVASQPEKGEAAGAARRPAKIASVEEMAKHIESLEAALIRAQESAGPQPEVVATEARLAELIKSVHAAQAKGDTEKASRLRNQAKRVFDQIVAAKHGKLTAAKGKARGASPGVKETGKAVKDPSIEDLWEHLARLEDALVRMENPTRDPPEVLATEKALRQLIEQIHAARSEGQEDKAAKLHQQARRVFEALVKARAGDRPRGPESVDGVVSSRSSTAKHKVAGKSLEDLWKHVEMLENALIRVESRIHDEPEVVAVEKRLSQLIQKIHASNEAGDSAQAERLRKQARRIFEKLMAARRGELPGSKDRE